MTKAMMDLRELVEKSGDADLLKEMIGFAAERLMELEVGVRAGAAWKDTWRGVSSFSLMDASIPTVCV